MGSESAARELVASLVEAYNRKDEDAIATLYADDVTYWSTLSGSCVGKGAVLDHVRELFRTLPDEQMEPEVVVTDGETTVVEFVSRGTGPGGAAYEIRFTEVMEAPEGLLTDIKVYLDPDEVSAALGD